MHRGIKTEALGEGIKIEAMSNLNSQTSTHNTARGTSHGTRSSWATKATTLRLTALLVGTVGLLACAPTQQKDDKEVRRVVTSSPVARASFYPYQSGLTWTYLKEGDPVNMLPYLYTNIGPTVFLGHKVQASRLTGRGAEQVWYRTYSSDGVLLYGFSKPGAKIALNPPLKEAPAENAWRIGYSWKGKSAVLVVDQEGKKQAEGNVEYQYLVQDRRPVTTPAGKFNVWVVTRQMSDDLGGMFPTTQQYWFVPFVGEVRTPESLVMIKRNFKSQLRKEPRK